MNLFSEIRGLVLDALAQMQSEGALPEGLSFDNVAVEPPRDAAHGDMATNAAMVLAKPARMKPRDIADVLAGKLAADDRITSAEVAGPGFLNLRLAPSVWQGVSGGGAGKRHRLWPFDHGAWSEGQRGICLGQPDRPAACRATRGARCSGMHLASLLAYSGHDVTREYYINDGGAQVDVLARSAYERYREANGLSPEIADGLYPGDYLIPIGEALKEKYGDSLIDKPESEWLEELRELSTDAMMDLIRADLKALGVEMDVFFSEKSLYGTGRIEAALQSLTDKGLIYEGVLEPPKGKKPEDWEPREQTLFKSTEHGDDVDRPVKKSDGSWTYFAPDIAYHYDKVTRGFDASDRRVWGGPWRLCQTDEGGRVGPVRWQGAAGYQADAAGEAVEKRRAVQDVEAGRELCHPARCGRSGWPRRDPFRDADPQERCAAGFRFRQGAGTKPREPRVLRAIRPCPGHERAAPRRRGRD